MRYISEMRPEAMQKYPLRQKGLGLVSAIFVITILALLVVGMGQFFKFGQQVSIQEMLTQRALMAANSGIELAFVCLTENGGMASGCNSTNSASPDRWPSSGSFSVAGLRECYAEVVHEQVDSAIVGRHWVVTSIGYCGNQSEGLGSASRRVIVALTES